MRISTLLAALLAALTLASSASATIVADSGFRPNPDGFSFENYAKAPYDDLGPAEVRRIFGRRVCAAVVDGACHLTPPAQAWMTEMNASMDGGHCFGFSVLSLLLFKHEIPPIGATPTTFGLAIEGDAALQRQIAYTWAWQDLRALQDDTVKGTPNEILATLRRALRPGERETYTLGVLAGDGGHAITPFAVDRVGVGRYDVLVYDNNWPGDTRRVRFDTKRDAYRYAGAPNPAANHLLFTGDARKPNIVLIPTTPGLGTHECPFCRVDAGSKHAYNELAIEGSPGHHAHLVARDPKGRRTGVVGGRVLEQIPGSRVVMPLGMALSTEQHEPRYQLPHDVGLDVTVDAAPLRRPDRELLTFTGPGYDVSISDLVLRPGERNRLHLAAHGRSFTYRTAPGQVESPTFSMGLERHGTDLSVRVRAHRPQGGSAMRFVLADAGHTLRLSSTATRPERYDIRIQGIGRGRLLTFRHTAVLLHPGDRATIHYGSLRSHPKALPLVIRHGGRRRVVALANQAS